MIGLQLEFLPGWMFSFTPKRVRPDLQEKIKRYRKECYRVLWEALLVSFQGLVQGPGLHAVNLRRVGIEDYPRAA